MVSSNIFLVCAFLFALLASLSPIHITMADSTSSSSSAMPKNYIIYGGARPEGVDPEANDIQTLTAVLGSEKAAKAAHLHSYKNFNGFVAKLTSKQADKMKEQPGVISVFRSKTAHFAIARKHPIVEIDD